MPAAVEVVNLSKRFSRQRSYLDMVLLRSRGFVDALVNVSLQVQPGECFGLLGPNGAGKTTLLKVVAGLVMPTTGQVFIHGMDAVKQARQAAANIGYALAEERSFYWRLTGRENLRFFATLNDIPPRQVGRRVAEVLEVVGLTAVADDRVITYSSGMKQRLALARALLTGPSILLLDEPTRSLDPLAARDFRRFVQEELLGKQRKTVLLATHNPEEATALCHRVAILHRGRVLASGTVEQLTTLARQSPGYRLTLEGIPETVLRGLDGWGAASQVRVLSNGSHTGRIGLEVMGDGASQTVSILIRDVLVAGGRVVDCSPLGLSLTDVIAGITGEKGA